MRLRGFKICLCGAEKHLHVGGSGHCEAQLTIPHHKCYQGERECLKFVATHGGGKMANAIRTPQGDSGEERDRHRMLIMLQNGGAIRGLKYQERIDITPPIAGYEETWWKLDYRYRERIDGKWVDVFEDWKGGASWTGESRLKVMLLMGRYCSGGRGVMRISYIDKHTGRMVIADMRTSYTVKKDRKGNLFTEGQKFPKRRAAA